MQFKLSVNINKQTKFFVFQIMVLFKAKLKYEKIHLHDIIFKKKLIFEIYVIINTNITNEIYVNAQNYTPLFKQIDLSKFTTVC